MVRASVSKTEGPRFESEHSCHPLKFRSYRLKTGSVLTGALLRPLRLQKLHLIMQFSHLPYRVLRCTTIRPFRHPLLKTFMAGLVPAFFFACVTRTHRTLSSGRTINRNRGSGAAGETGTGKTIVRGIERPKRSPPPLLQLPPNRFISGSRGRCYSPLPAHPCFTRPLKLSAALPTARTDLPPRPFTGSG